MSLTAPELKIHLTIVDFALYNGRTWHSQEFALDLALAHENLCAQMGGLVARNQSLEATVVFTPHNFWRREVSAHFAKR